MKYSKQYYLDNKEKFSKVSKEYYQRNKDQIKIRVSQYVKDNKENVYSKIKKYRKENPHITRNNNWKRKGIFIEPGKYFQVEDYDRKLLECGKKCEICSRDNISLIPDHDHSTGFFRGIICTYCNTALSYFRDDPKSIEAAIIYLNKS